MNNAVLCEAIRKKRPLVHCISNIVTANDCANLILAVGGSAMMAQEEREMPEIVNLADSVVLNTGTPDAAKFAACTAAGRAANDKGIPVVLDPVGVGASRWRQGEVFALLKEVHPSILRVNAGEAMALLGMGGNEQGVDSETAKEPERLSKSLAQKLGCAVLLTGDADVVSDGRRLCRVEGGSARMRRITGAGCMLSALCGAFAAVEPDGFIAACEASRFWKSCAAEAEHEGGIGSFRIALFDAAEKLSFNL